MVVSNTWLRRSQVPYHLLKQELERDTDGSAVAMFYLKERNVIDTAKERVVASGQVASIFVQRAIYKI
jgi:hypothetical protein